MKVTWSNLWQIPEAIGFALANVAKNSLDCRIYSYPSTRIARVENGDGTSLAYVPIHNGIILESVGWAPELSAGDKVQAGIAAVTEIEKAAWEMGVREVFFVSSDQRTNQFCQEHLGYEPVKVMRKRL